MGLVSEGKFDQLRLLADYAELARRCCWDPQFIDTEDNPGLLIGRRDARVLVMINGSPERARRFVGPSQFGSDGYPLLSLTATAEISDTSVVNGWLREGCAEAAVFDGGRSR